MELNERHRTIPRRQCPRRRGCSPAAAQFPQSLYRRLTARYSKVPMREISQSDTDTAFGGEESAGLCYDCSGPYSGSGCEIDIRSGLPALRAQWIAERGDVEELDGLSSEFGRMRAVDAKPMNCVFLVTPQTAPRQDRQERLADALRTPRHHHAGDGIRRYPRKQQSSCLY